MGASASRANVARASPSLREVMLLKQLRRHVSFGAVFADDGQRDELGTNVCFGEFFLFIRQVGLIGSGSGCG